jgi:NADH-quinone oxidoreductase subunit C
MFDITNLLEKLNSNFVGQIQLSENGQAIYAKTQHIVQLLQTLKEKYNYVRLVDITAVDYEDRYEVVYHLTDNEAALLAIKVKLQKDNNIIPTIVSIWEAANTQEREIYDLMGIVFEGHGNLTRILCPDDFAGHALQKSYKLDKVSRF